MAMANRPTVSLGGREQFVEPSSPDHLFLCFTSNVPCLVKSEVR